uniref:ADP-ribosyl cyclase/cyclic ADP-ribose hydrolase n=1 Tax=Anopheles minimus TaxID=112268 RepID=A0A182WMD7_9DIPT
MSDIADTGSPTLPTRHNLFATSNGPLASTTSGSLASATSTSSMTTSQELLNSSRSSSKSSKLSSSTSTTTKHVEKSSSSTQRMSSLTSSSSSKTSTAAVKQNLGEMQNSMAEMKNMMGHSSSSTSQNLSTSSSSIKSSAVSNHLQARKMSAKINDIKSRLRSSMDSLDDPQADPLVTFPDSETDDDLSSMASALKPLGSNGGSGILVPNGHHQALVNGCAGTVDTVKFEQKKMTSESKTKVTTDGFSSEQATINSAESKKMQAGELQYQEQAALAAMSSRMEMNGVTAEEKGAILKVISVSALRGSRTIDRTMCSQAPWPVRKGIFRSTGQSDFVPTRTPSPVVEFPLSPPPPTHPGSSPSPLGSCSSKSTSPVHSHRNGITLNVASPLNSPRVTVVESPLGSPASIRTTFEIPIESVTQEARSVKMGDFQQAEANNIAAHSRKVQSDHFSAENKAISQAQQKQTVSSSGIFNQEKHVSSTTQSTFTMSNTSTISSSSQMSTLSSSSAMNGLMGDEFPSFEDFERLGSTPEEIDGTIMKYSKHLASYVQNLQQTEQLKQAPTLLNHMNEIIRRAWAVPTHGHELGASLCDTLRNTGGLDILMRNCVDNDSEVQFSSARLLEQCLTTENRTHVVKNGLDKVVNVACVCTRNNATDHSRVGTGILEHLFKHSEDTCSNVIRLGGLDAVLFECRKNDIETLRHCAGALANLSLYGGSENQEAMINRKVPSWLFPLAFHNDENIKYYACLAIVVLVANKEIEAEVIKSGTLNLVEPFVTTHNPSEFAKSNLAHAHGQSKHWLQRLVPVLSSKREEARNLAAFHFCMEAGIKKEQGNTNIFKEIGAIEPLIRVASSPNAIASKFAAQALRLIGEEVPHKLSQQVPLWSTEDVREWVKQIGFGEYEQSFYDSKVDGDLLLQMQDCNLCNDIGMTNGILRIRFLRELQNLKKMADYSSRDPDGLHTFLSRIGPEYPIYTYTMLNAGVDIESLRTLDEDQLTATCGITNAIHRSRILQVIKMNESISAFRSEQCSEKSLDVFVSYRRSNGSQLASLLKVHLELRGFSVFIDVERLEAGKFDNNLLQSIRHARHFLLVLTPDALNRCVDDVECKDWVHREIVAALNSECNIIPIIDNFQWPEPEKLPEDMRGVCHFNGIRWIHDYQDACVDKVERFMRAETNGRGGLMDHVSRLHSRQPGDATPSSAIYQRMHSSTGSLNGNPSAIPTNSSASPHHPRYYSSLAQLYRKSSSPARQGPTGGSGGARIGAYRYAKPNRGVPGGMNSLPRMQNSRATELRRSSAAGLNVVSQRPPLPPKIELRSHSYDGLLDDSVSMQRRKTTGVGQPTGTKVSIATEGNDRVDGQGKILDRSEGEGEEEQKKQSQIARKVFVETSGGPVGTEASIKSKNRRSRSMDDLFDDDGPGVECNFLDNTQSMETLLEPVSPISTTAECTPETTPPARSMGGNICLNRRFVREETVDPADEIQEDSPGSQSASHEKLCEKETITVDSTPRFQGDDREAQDPKKQTDEQEDDIESTHSSVTSSPGSTASGPRKAPKPLINRYVKKVKSFMKM